VWPSPISCKRRKGSSPITPTLPIYRRSLNDQTRHSQPVEQRECPSPRRFLSDVIDVKLSVPKHSVALERSDKTHDLCFLRAMTTAQAKEKAICTHGHKHPPDTRHALVASLSSRTVTRFVPWCQRFVTMYVVQKSRFGRRYCFYANAGLCHQAPPSK
jgi:hypothetical protein